MLTDSETEGMARRRALLTDRERELIADENAESQRYVAISRVRTKIAEELPKDISILEEHHPDLLEELRDAVCENGQPEDIAINDSSSLSGDSNRGRGEADRTSVSPSSDKPEGTGSDYTYDELQSELQEWLEDRPPRTPHAKKAMVRIFELLYENQTMGTGELKEEVYSLVGDEYDNKKAMWDSLNRYLKDVPGIEDAGYAQFGYAGDEVMWEQLVGKYDE